jgi:hypothetical protein
MSSDRPPAARPLEFLALAMIVVGLALAFDHVSGAFGQWRARGIEQFSGGFLDPRLERPLNTFEGILGGTLVGKWACVLALVRFGPLGREAWVTRALAWGVVVMGGFEAALFAIGGMPVDTVVPELGIAAVGGVLIWRTRPGDSAVVGTRGNSGHKGARVFAWVNVALGLSLGTLLTHELFAVYRDGMSKAWRGALRIPESLGRGDLRRHRGRVVCGRFSGLPHPRRDVQRAARERPGVVGDRCGAVADVSR